MSTTMDQIHHIRDMFYRQDKNISEIASETGLNWKTVKKYVDMEDFNNPSPKPASSEVHESKLDPFKPLIDEWLQADKLAPRKQRHTAKRVFKRLKDEADGFGCSYRLVALYVKQKKEELRLKRTDGYIPLNHHPGEAQSDFGTATRLSTLCSVFPTVTEVSSSLIMAKTWNVFWKDWLPYLSTSVVFPRKSGLTIPEPLLPKSSKVAGVM